MGHHRAYTLPKTDMEPEKGAFADYGPFQRGVFGGGYGLLGLRASIAPQDPGVWGFRGLGV